MGHFVRIIALIAEEDHAGEGFPADAARAGVLAGEEIAITKTFAPGLVSTIVIFAVVMIELPRTVAAHKANAHPEKDQKNDDERQTGNAKSLLAPGHSVPKNLAQKPRRDEARADENHHERNRFQLGAFRRAGRGAVFGSGVSG